MLKQISVVMLGVSSLDRALPFYRDTLGLTVRQKIPGFVFLDGGGVMLALSEPLAKNAAAIAGATEVVFAVDSVKAAHSALRRKGVEFVQNPRVVTGAMWAANFRDPDGHFLSLFGPE
jgi:catechol 2,3-dioxygenase-like lactoylglutathione lyase family enzyme